MGYGVRTLTGLAESSHTVRSAVTTELTQLACG